MCVHSVDREDLFWPLGDQGLSTWFNILQWGKYEDKVITEETGSALGGKSTRKRGSPYGVAGGSKEAQPLKESILVSLWASLTRCGRGSRSVHGECFTHSVDDLTKVEGHEMRPRDQASRVSGRALTMSICLSTPVNLGQYPSNGLSTWNATIERMANHVRPWAALVAKISGIHWNGFL